MHWLNTKRIPVFCLALLFVLLSGSRSVLAGGDNDIDTGRIDAFIQHEMKAGNIPGLALGIIKGDRVVYLKGFGTAGPGKGNVTPDTSFILGSVSKSFTGLAIVQLAEKGVLDLDAPVKKYIPWLSIGGPGISGSIKVSHLLNHTSGIPAYEGHDSGIERGCTIVERIRLKGNIRLNHSPGSVFEYSSLNYDILGALIEAVSGQSYEQYIQSSIFQPLGMVNSFTSFEEASGKSLAVGYRPWFGFQVPAEIKYSMSALPSGYIASSAGDMTHFLMAFVNQGKYKDKTVLSGDGIEKAQASTGNTGYGAGWFSSGYYKWHTGELANFNAYMCTVPSEKLGLIMLSNTNDIGTKFLNQSSSALRRIPEGIRLMFVGGELPDDIWLNAKTMYILADLFILLLLVLVARFFFWPGRMGLNNKAACFRSGLRAAVALAISALLLCGIPLAFKASWHALMISVPDLTFSIMVISLLLIVAAAKKISLLYQIKRRCE